MLSGNGGLQNTSFFRPPENVVTSAVLDETRFLVRDKRECFTGNSKHVTIFVFISWKISKKTK